MKLLILDTRILAAGEIEDNGSELVMQDRIIPKHIIEGYSIVDVDVPADFFFADWLWIEGELVKQGPDAEAIAAAKKAKNEQINKWREEANRSTFTYEGKVFAIDALSRSDFDGVANNIALKGTFPEGFPNAWKAVDNSYILLPTIADFADLYGAMTATGSANFAKSQQLKAALATATTLEEVEAIVWA